MVAIRARNAWFSLALGLVWFHTSLTPLYAPSLSPNAQKIYDDFRNKKSPFNGGLRFDSPKVAAGLRKYGISQEQAEAVLSELMREKPDFRDVHELWKTIDRLTDSPKETAPAAALRRAEALEVAVGRFETLTGAPPQMFRSNIPIVTSQVLRILQAMHDPKSSFHLFHPELHSDADKKSVEDPTTQPGFSMENIGKLYEGFDAARWGLNDYARQGRYAPPEYERSELAKLRERGLEAEALRLRWLRSMPTARFGNVPRRLQWHELSKDSQQYYLKLVQAPQEPTVDEMIRLGSASTTSYLSPAEQQMWGELEAFDPELNARIQRGEAQMRALGQPIAREGLVLAARRGISLDASERMYRHLEALVYPAGSGGGKPLSPMQVEGLLTARLAEYRRQTGRDLADPMVRQTAERIRIDLEQMRLPGADKKLTPIDPMVLRATMESALNEELEVAGRRYLETLLELGYKLREFRGAPITRAQLDAGVVTVDRCPPPVNTPVVHLNLGKGPEQVWVQKPGDTRWKDSIDFAFETRNFQGDRGALGLALHLKANLRSLATSRMWLQSYKDPLEWLDLLRSDYESNSNNREPLQLTSSVESKGILGWRGAALLAERSLPEHKRPSASVQVGAIGDRKLDAKDKPSTHNERSGMRFTGTQPEMDPFQTDETSLFRVSGTGPGAVLELASDGEPAGEYKFAKAAETKTTVRTERPQLAKNGVLPLGNLRGFTISGLRVRDKHGRLLVAGEDYTVRASVTGKPLVIFADENEAGAFHYETETVRDAASPAASPLLLTDGPALEKVAVHAASKGLDVLARGLRLLIARVETEKRAVTSADLEALVESLGRYSYSIAPSQATEAEWFEPLGGLRHYLRDGFFNYQCAQATKMLRDMVQLYNRFSGSNLPVEALTLANVPTDGVVRSKALHAQAAGKDANGRALFHDPTPRTKDPVYPQKLGDRIAAQEIPPDAPSAHEASRTAAAPAGRALGSRLKSGVQKVFGAVKGAVAKLKWKGRPELVPLEEVAETAANPAAAPAVRVRAAPGDRHRLAAEVPQWVAALRADLKRLRENPSYRHEALGVRDSETNVGMQISELAHMMDEYHQGRATLVPQGWKPGARVEKNGRVDYNTGRVYRSVLGVLQDIGVRTEQIESVDEIPEKFRQAIEKLRERLNVVQAEAPTAAGMLGVSFRQYQDFKYIKALKDVLDQLDRTPWAATSRVPTRGPASGQSCGDTMGSFGQ